MPILRLIGGGLERRLQLIVRWLLDPKAVAVKNYQRVHGIDTADESQKANEDAEEVAASRSFWD